ncbi:isopentenyl-diphosphate delta-isomerase [Methanothermobacter sp. MT-2]|nr:isopentenyl-diphosphate delta-isomerase [Methanothermobacter sp. MT-2]HHW04293.1 type 2 isopentenyl-diphosphate Delta-isomerase [Methanothermobacter sp.]
MISDRKLEHLILCTYYDVQYKKDTGFKDVELVHHALTQVNTEEIDLSIKLLGKKLKSPILITAITGGHPAAYKINKALAKAAEKLGIGLGVGSQRAAIEDPTLEATYTIARKEAPSTLLIGNIGAPQIEHAEAAVKMIDADALAIHLNPLQESIQPGGDINSTGLINSIKKITENINVPVIVKETGAGISAEDALKLEEIGVAAIDIAGAGGTSWAAVETYRAKEKYLGKLYWDWGIPTAASTVEVTQTVKIPVIASGGIRSGLDAAKAIALGADGVGIALPVLKAAQKGYKEVIKVIERFNKALEVAMYLVGAQNIKELRRVPVVIKGETRTWLHERGFDTSKYARRPRY